MLVLHKSNVSQVFLIVRFTTFDLPYIFLCVKILKHELFFFKLNIILNTNYGLEVVQIMFSAVDLLTYNETMIYM